MILPLIYMVVSFWMSGMSNKFSVFIESVGCTLLSVVAGEAIGLFVGAAVYEMEKAITIMTVFTLFLMLLGGFFVPSLSLGASTSALSSMCLIRHSSWYSTNQSRATAVVHSKDCATTGPVRARHPPSKCWNLLACKAVSGSTLACCWYCALFRGMARTLHCV